MNSIIREKLNELGHEPTRFSTLWAITPNTQDNPSLILARLMQEAGAGIWVSKVATNPGGVRLDTHVSIHGTPIGKKIFGDISLQSAEQKALWNAYRQTSEPNVEGCKWDEPTKRRVKAWYWQRKADESRNWNLPRYVEEAEEKARGLLGVELKPLTLEEITTLVQETLTKY